MSKENNLDKINHSHGQNERTAKSEQVNSDRLFLMNLLQLTSEVFQHLCLLLTQAWHYVSRRRRTDPGRPAPDTDDGGEWSRQSAFPFPSSFLPWDIGK